MTVKDVVQLREQGRMEEAYEVARSLYAADKGADTSLAMFWTATDILRIRLDQGRRDEARKIVLALERMLPNVPDNEGEALRAMERCKALLSEGAAGEQPSDEGPDHLQMGVWGEELASVWLREKGYVILERDWRSGHRDIDIIARKDELLVFVEVKTRRSRDFAEPTAAVDHRKQRHLLSAINHYLRSRHIDSPWRFDVVTVVGEIGCPAPDVEHIEDFQLVVPIQARASRWRR